ncbi:hypothetical protein ACHAPZ_009457 [Fusarium culmorum]
MSDRTAIHYTVDPSTNPSTWPGSDPTGSTVVWKVDVIYINIHGDSNFRILRAGTNEHVNQAVIQATKHIARGLYDIASMNMSFCSKMDFLGTEDDPQPEVVLK